MSSLTKPRCKTKLSSTAPEIDDSTADQTEDRLDMDFSSQGEAQTPEMSVVIA